MFARYSTINLNLSSTLNYIIIDVNHPFTNNVKQTCNQYQSISIIENIN